MTEEPKNTETVVVTTPKPLPRKSSRVKKKPNWLGDYQYNKIIDNESKRDALNKLIMSGILSIVSLDVANKIWEAVMK